MIISKQGFSNFEFFRLCLCFNFHIRWSWKICHFCTKIRRNWKLTKKWQPEAEANFFSFHSPPFWWFLVLVFLSIRPSLDKKQNIENRKKIQIYLLNMALISSCETNHLINCYWGVMTYGFIGCVFYC